MKSFHKFAKKSSELFGSSWAFMLALGLCVVWFVSGFIFKFSEMWQMIMNTFTSVVTFLMVFLIQSTQNRDSESVLIKLNELILSHKPARNNILNLNALSNEELSKLHKEYEKLASAFSKEEKARLKEKIKKEKKKD